MASTHFPPILVLPSYMTTTPTATHYSYTPMTNMSLNNSSASAFQGFSVLQPSLGAVLQWLPAVGTPELDDMVNAFLPGPASIQDKRAHISMDFFEYARQTGETFKFYPVSAASHASASNSPASSTTFYDSAYNSSFDTSPVVSDMSSWAAPSPATFSSSASSSEQRGSRGGPRMSPKKSSSASGASTSARQPSLADFSGHPGMRIMTKDGRDVTNSASRGSKTKEQRDHAHLMRIIRACDSCKRKKTKCDPSHRKRSAAQAAQGSQAEAKPTKKAKRGTDPPSLATAAVGADLGAPDAFPEFDEALELSSFPYETSSESLDDLWDQFVRFEPEPVAFSHGGAQVQPQVHPQVHPQEDYDFFFDPQGHFSPSPGSSPASPSLAFAPFTPAPAVPQLTHLYPSGGLDEDQGLSGLAPSDGGRPTLPYLNPDNVHGTNYVDFNLYSPASDFLDEEPKSSLKTRRPTVPASRNAAADEAVGSGDDQSASSSFYQESYQDGSPGLSWLDSSSNSSRGSPGLSSRSSLSDSSSGSPFGLDASQPSSLVVIAPPGGGTPRVEVHGWRQQAVESSQRVTGGQSAAARDDEYSSRSFSFAEQRASQVSAVRVHSSATDILQVIPSLAPSPVAPPSHAISTAQSRGISDGGHGQTIVLQSPSVLPQTVSSSRGGLPPQAAQSSSHVSNAIVTRTGEDAAAVRVCQDTREQLGGILAVSSAANVEQSRLVLSSHTRPTSSSSSSSHSSSGFGLEVHGTPSSDRLQIHRALASSDAVVMLPLASASPRAEGASSSTATTVLGHAGYLPDRATNHATGRNASSSSDQLYAPRLSVATVRADQSMRIPTRDSELGTWSDDSALQSLALTALVLRGDGKTWPGLKGSAVFVSLYLVSFVLTTLLRLHYSLALAQAPASGTSLSLASLLGGLAVLVGTGMSSVAVVGSLERRRSRQPPRPSPSTSKERSTLPVDRPVAASRNSTSGSVTSGLKNMVAKAYCAITQFGQRLSSGIPSGKGDALPMGRVGGFRLG